MGIVFRQSIKTTMVTFMGALLGALLNYLYILTLTPAELGGRFYLVYMGAVFQFFVLLGTGSTLATYLPRYANEPLKKQLLLTLSFLAPLVTTLVVTALLFVFKAQVIASLQPQDRAFMSTYYSWFPLLILLWSYVTMFDMFLLTQIKVALSAFVREVVIRLCGLAILVLFALQVISFHWFILLTIVSYIIPVIILWGISARSGDFRFSTSWSAFSKADYREFARFSWYHLLLGASFYLLGYIDALMLAPLDKAGMSVLAVYGNAVFIVALMQIPYRAIGNASFSVMNLAYADKDTAKLHDLYRRSGVNILIVSLAMFCLIFCNLHNLVAILPPGKGYEMIAPVVIILMVGRLVEMATGLNDQLISISSYYKFNFRTSLALLAAVFLLNRLLIPQYGVLGAAWSISIALAVFNILKMWYLWYRLRMLPFSGKTPLILLMGGVSCALGYYLPQMGHPVVDTCIRSSLALLLFAGLLVAGKASPDLTEYIKIVRSSKRLF